MTVPRALSGHPSVTDETRPWVMLTAEEIGYRPNRWARNSVTGRSMMIGFVVPDISHVFNAEITLGMPLHLERQGFGLHFCNSGQDSQAEVREIELILANRVEGLIIASNPPEDDFRYFEGLREQGLPVVFVDRSFPTQLFSFLVAGDFEVGRLATRHLVEL